MGATQVCQARQSKQIQSNEGVKPTTCFINICNRVDTAENTKMDQKIVPIQFSDIEIESVIKSNELQKQAEMIDAKEFVAKEGISTSSNLKPYPNSYKEQQVENVEVLVVKKREQGQLEVGVGSELYEPVSAPFSVIKLVLKPEILKQIKKIDINFERIHENPQSQTYSTWKLQAKGFYSNKISDGTCIMITENQYYKGNIKNNLLIPENKGMLINLFGIYRGNFKNGKANGKGNFVLASGKKKYEGYWENGALLRGKVQSDEFKYEGQFENGTPHGKGVLQLYKSKVKYTGQFVNGVFEDDNGHYQCESYEYKGGFREGKKNGQGELTKKYSSGKKSGSYLKSDRALKGNWQDDEFKPQALYK